MNCESTKTYIKNDDGKFIGLDNLDSLLSKNKIDMSLFCKIDKNTVSLTHELIIIYTLFSNDGKRSSYIIREPYCKRWVKGG